MKSPKMGCNTSKLPLANTPVASSVASAVSSLAQDTKSADPLTNKSNNLMTNLAEKTNKSNDLITNLAEKTTKASDLMTNLAEKTNKSNGLLKLSSEDPESILKSALKNVIVKQNVVGTMGKSHHIIKYYKF